ncbi:MAG: hypothetical protein R2813_05885 [Flavobacteriales bacterium]
MKKSNVYLLLSSVGLTVACGSKVELVNQIQNNTDHDVTVQYQTSSAGGAPELLKPGETRIFRIKEVDESESSTNCPFDIGNEDSYRIYDGDDTIRLETIIDSLPCEYSEMEKKGLRGHDQRICTCFYE